MGTHQGGQGRPISGTSPGNLEMLVLGPLPRSAESKRNSRGAIGEVAAFWALTIQVTPCAVKLGDPWSRAPQRSAPVVTLIIHVITVLFIPLGRRGDPPSVLADLPGADAQRGFLPSPPHPECPPRPHPPTAARRGPLCEIHPRPSGCLAAFGTTQTSRVAGAKEPEAGRPNASAKNLGARAGRGAHRSPRAAALPSGTRVRLPGPRGLRASRAARPGHRDWPAASPGSR